MLRAAATDRALRRVQTAHAGHHRYEAFDGTARAARVLLLGCEALAYLVTAGVAVGGTLNATRIQISFGNVHLTLPPRVSHADKVSPGSCPRDRTQHARGKQLVSLLSVGVLHTMTRGSKSTRALSGQHGHPSTPRSGFDRPPL